uniref:Rho GDP-dissociation inhibitor 1 n=1 Tax=Oncorhynchus tshawytscha TaxID=74940 RepID=A0AAZ3NT88_ONCTS
MAEQDPTPEQLAAIAAANEEAEGGVNYKPPAQKSLQEIQELDKDDESLRKYKEIVSGLKYAQQTYRKGVKVDKSDYMVGSYGPRPAEYEFLTPLEEAPKGMLARGTYNIKSKFTDDDKHDHLSWEWNLNIKKEWKD